MSRFFDIGFQHHLGNEDYLSKIGALLDWRTLSVLLQDGTHAWWTRMIRAAENIPMPVIVGVIQLNNPVLGAEPSGASGFSALYRLRHQQCASGQKNVFPFP